MNKRISIGETEFKSPSRYLTATSRSVRELRSLTVRAAPDLKEKDTPCTQASGVSFLFAPACCLRANPPPATFLWLRKTLNSFILQQI